MEKELNNNRTTRTMCINDYLLEESILDP